MERIADGPSQRPKHAWLVHDTRTPGFLTAALLARRLRTEGFVCQPVAGSEHRRGRRGIVTEQAKEFWTDGIRIVQGVVAPGDRLYLCSITFDTKGDRSAMQSVWAGIRSMLGPEAMIVLSQRWPDHYAEIDAKSYLVPLELPEEQRTRTDHFERLIADLIFVASHQADPLEVSPLDLALLDQLGSRLRAYYRADPARTEQAASEADGEEFDPARGLFDALVDEDSAMRELETWRKAPAIPPPKWHSNVLSESHAYVITIPPEEDEHRQGKLRAVLGQLTSNRFGIGVGVQDGPRGYRVFLIRRDDVVVDRPSLLRMLLESDRVPHDGWLASDENTLTFVPHLATEPKWINCRKETLQQSVQRWVEEAAAENLVGDLGAPAALAKVLCQAGDDALAKLDLTKSYFPKFLRFRPSDTIIRFDRGNRSSKDEIRQTLVLTLEVASAEALTFLMRGNGYVLSKLEMQLEGVRLGLLNARSPWLWSVRLAERIRINTDVVAAAIGPDKAGNLAKGLRQDVTAIPLSGIPSSSVIGKALDEAGAQRVIAYRETEMIGPSVQYGRVAAALAAVLARTRDESLQVLDLFSGSGFSAWALKQECRTASLICVDSAVPFDQTLVSKQRDILWLCTSVEQVVGVGGHQGILSREYDLILMDPPHAALLDMLFGGLVEALLASSSWLLVYQGHTSQSGRGRALVTALTEFSRDPARTRCVAIMIIDSEELVICGPPEWKRGRSTVPFLQCLRECSRDRGLSGHSVRLLDPKTGAHLQD